MIGANAGRGAGLQQRTGTVPTMSGAEPDGVDAKNVTRWFAEHLPEAMAPLRFGVIAGGHSNITVVVTDAGNRRFVLRRPPLNSVLATAHDMVREWRVINALQHTQVPVPPAYGLCTDAAITGAPFYVMGFVDGHVQHSLDVTLAVSTAEQRRITGESLCDVLVDLHAVDIDGVGLGNHGPRSGYLERQLRRWFEQYSVTATKPIPDLDSSYQRLLDLLPRESEVTIAHGDYRLGNCITSAEGPITAVLDWEISTLGDPLADLAYCLNTWARPDNAIGTLAGSETLPSMADGFPSTDDLLRRYADRSGRDVSRIGYYTAFNHWKYACIVQGVLSRYRSGALGDPSSVDLDGFARSIDQRATSAREALDSMS